MDIEKLYRNYLKDVKLMQLATCENNQPWLCNVWFVNDDNNNIYWISRETREHSKQIKNNSNVACTFHKWFEEGLGQKGQALVISGQAEKLAGNVCEGPYDLYSKSYPKVLEFQTKKAFLNDEGHHFFYKVTPKRIVWFDEINFPEDPRQEVL